MPVREIPPGEWAPFLEGFSRDHRSWLATLEWDRPGAPARTADAGRPLAAVTPETAEGRIVAVAITFQDGPEDRRVDVGTPRRLRVTETAWGTIAALEIENDRGECTRVRFRAAPLPEALDGLAPGEI